MSLLTGSYPGEITASPAVKTGYRVLPEMLTELIKK